MMLFVVSLIGASLVFAKNRSPRAWSEEGKVNVSDELANAYAVALQNK